MYQSVYKVYRPTRKGSNLKSHILTLRGSEKDLNDYPLSLRMYVFLVWTTWFLCKLAMLLPFMFLPILCGSWFLQCILSANRTRRVRVPREGACLMYLVPQWYFGNKGKGASNYYVSIKGKFLIIIEALISCRLLVDQVIYTFIDMY